MMNPREVSSATASATSSAASCQPPRSVETALADLLDRVVAISGNETIDTAAARGRVLASPLESALDVPAADNAQMDGYAVRAEDLVAASPGTPVHLPVSQRIAAGRPGAPLAAASAARIFTGAVIPAGANAVVMQESASADPAGGSVSFAGPTAAGEWIRRRGEDIRRGQTILPAGTRLHAQHLGLAASIGTARVAVVRRPRVAIFSTGDELAMPGEVAVADLPPGMLFNSNRFVLRGLIEALGCEVVDLGIVPDTLPATREALVSAADRSDCIVTSGGVSVGEEDHLRPAVAAEGEIAFWRIAIKPGKPLAFGHVRSAGGASLFVGLPGNPVSSFVTFLIFVRPLLLRLHGIADVSPPAYTLRADFVWSRPDARQEYLRVKVNASGGLNLHPQQGSGVLTSTVWADGLLENPPGRRIAPGDAVRFLPFAALVA